MASTLDERPAPVRETRRFQEKKALVLDAASALINEKGAAGMTLAAVADAVGLNTASVTYYFKRRDDLAVACYHRALERIEAMVAAAALEPTPQARVRRYLALNIDLLRQVRAGEARPITVLSDIRTMDDPVRIGLSDRYRTIMRAVRGFWGADGDAAHKALLVARAHVLLENAYWLPVWIGRYSSHDFSRVLDRMVEIFDHGLAPDGPLAQDWPLVDGVAGDHGSDGAAQRKFLQAATRLINERGYRGASVERIASELSVTKGSFYHHLEAKDDLVLACFHRSFETVTQAQRLADELGGDHLARLMVSVATLLDVQFSERGPLLRTTALQALPVEFRAGVVDSSNRIARRFAGTIIDGISEGSIRAVDPLIASQILMPMLNSAYELRGWASSMSSAEAIRSYASTIASGLFDR
jgi:AcrR family transcriptional regulator